MAGTITITCPECTKQLKAPPEVAGKKIRCKSCGATFVAKGATGKAAPAKKDDDDDEIARDPYGMVEVDLSYRCPNCANKMLDDDAIICVHCGYNTVTREKATTRKVRDVTGGDVALWLLPGIVCAIGVVSLITFDVLYCVMIEDWVDKDAWYSFLDSMGAKIWIVIVSLFFIWLMGKFAFKR